MANNKRTMLRRRAMKKQKGLCYWCGQMMAPGEPGQGAVRHNTVTADRIIPGAEGGKYVKGNVVAACYRCNTRRGHTPVAEFRITIRCDAVVAALKP